MLEIILSSSVLILAVIALRLIFRNRISQRLQYAVWLLVALRLLIPVQFGSASFSVNTLVRDQASGHVEQLVSRPVAAAALAPAPQSEAPVLHVAPVGEAAPVRDAAPVETAEGAPAFTVGQVLLIVYLVGFVGMLSWFSFVNLRFRRRVMRTAEPLIMPDCPVPVWMSQQIASPCVTGLFRPVILLTPECAADPVRCRMVLLHEQTHITQNDPIWTHLRCLCLCLHWFNPLVWAAALLSRQDCELSCDEGVMKRLDEQERLTYGRTLVHTAELASQASRLMQATTAMGETKKQIRHRIVRIARRPKSMLLAVISTVCILALTTGVVFTGAVEIQPNTPHLVSGQAGTDLVIPEGITEITDSMFAGDLSFSGVVIPDSVTVIGENAFSGCANLKRVTVPESVVSIGSGAFSNCQSLTEITLPARLSSMGDGVFQQCAALTAVTLPAGLDSVPAYTFSGCRNLRTAVIPSGISQIGDQAFTGCASLANLQIPAGTARIGSFAFLGCNSLTNIVVPEGVTIVEKRAFSNCTRLQTVTIPGSLEFIGFSAFYDCPVLTHIYYFGSIQQWQEIEREQGLFIIDPSVQPQYQQSVHIHYESDPA